MAAAASGGNSDALVAAAIEEGESFVTSLAEFALPTEFSAEVKRLLETLRAVHLREQAGTREVGKVNKDLDALRRAKAESEQELLDLQAAQRQLTEEIERATASVAAVRVSVAKRTDELSALQADCAKLQDEVDIGSDWTADQLTTREKLVAELDQERMSLDNARSALSAARSKAGGLRDEAARARSKLATLEADVAQVEREIMARKEEIKQASLHRETQDSALIHAQGRVKELERELAEKKALATSSAKEALAATNALRASREEMDKLTGQYDSLQARVLKLTDELDKATHSNEMLAGELHDMETAVGDINKETEVVAAEAAHAKQLTELTLQKVAEANTAREVAEQRQADVRDKATAAADAASQQRKQNTADLAVIADLKREREVLTRSVAGAADKVRRVRDLIALHKTNATNIESEVSAYRTSVRDLHKQVETMLGDRAKTAAAVTDATRRHTEAVEHVKVQELQAAALQRKITEQTTKLKQQQSLYESVRIERNSYSKQLVECQAAVEEMKRQFKALNFQIQSLKDEITAKDHSLVKEHFDHQKVRSEKETLANELAKIRKQTVAADTILANQESEILKLNRIIAEADEERNRQEKEFNAVVSERDVLSTQLVRREEELSKLYEKLKVLSSTLARGAATYNARLKELSELRDALAEARGHAQLAETQVSNLPELEHEVLRLEEALMQERVKARALEDELARPLHVHRWRQLEVSEPERYALIMRVQELQKTLMQAHSDMEAKASEIAKAEAAYRTLKEALARAPGAEVYDQLEAAAAAVKAKSKQLDRVRGEIARFHDMKEELADEVAALDARLQAVSTEYVRRVGSGDAPRPGEMPMPAAAARVLGGGAARPSTSAGAADGPELAYDGLPFDFREDEEDAGPATESKDSKVPSP